MEHEGKNSVFTKFPSPLNEQPLSAMIYLSPRVAGPLNQLKAQILQEKAFAFRCSCEIAQK